MTILDFLFAGQKMKLVARGWNGSEYKGACPSCGGRDRFSVWPEHSSGAKGGRYWCRQCGASGDGIQFLRDFADATYQEACEVLGVEKSTRGKVKVASSYQEKSWTPEPEQVPGQVWQDRARSLLQGFQNNLDMPEAREVLTRRFLNPSFARKHGLGWNPADIYESPEVWGLEPWINSKGNPGKVCIPAGLVIPSFRKTGLAALKVRRHNWTPESPYPKYQIVKGSCNGGLVLGNTGLPVVVVESELDALLIRQEAGDLCAVLALGSAANKPHAAATHFLRESPLILVALDFDEAGLNGLPWWKGNFPNAVDCPTIEGKDPGEMHKAGVSVRRWVEIALKVFLVPEANSLRELPSEQAENRPDDLEAIQTVTCKNCTGDICFYEILEGESFINGLCSKYRGNGRTYF